MWLELLPDIVVVPAQCSNRSFSILVVHHRQQNTQHARTHAHAQTHCLSHADTQDTHTEPTWAAA
jgi:hypothetical protein